MLAEDVQPRTLVIGLRRQANYWRGQHARAVQREAAARAKAQQLKQVVRDQQAQIAELTRQVEALQGKVAWLQQQVFGRKSEQSLEATNQACGYEDVPDASESSSPRQPPENLEAFLPWNLSNQQKDA